MKCNSPGRVIATCRCYANTLREHFTCSCRVLPEWLFPLASAAGFCFWLLLLVIAATSMVSGVWHTLGKPQGVSSVISSSGTQWHAPKYPKNVALFVVVTEASCALVEVVENSPMHSRAVER